MSYVDQIDDDDQEEKLYGKNPIGDIIEEEEEEEIEEEEEQKKPAKKNLDWCGFCHREKDPKGNCICNNKKI